VISDLSIHHNQYPLDITGVALLFAGRLPGLQVIIRQPVMLRRPPQEAVRENESNSLGINLARGLAAQQ